ncbi:putative peptidase (DUF1758) domain-containing protein [Ditylenchus destructor]|uniref:Peptidase (DUF1758) domain-containing protein n=1 Tax=Ditylenchus destructor TaxID=166010 RepID=A0AAD4N3Z5_9BILA|nr:putative peptidase (DUF1758) domain-containing protein [Ditylenchus destructor]
MEVAAREARTYLDSLIDFSFPEFPEAPPDSKTCRDKIQQFNYLLEDLQPILNTLENGLANWGQLRVVMSKEERLKDTPIIEKFLSDYHYCELVVELQKYIKNVGRARKRYQDVIPPEVASSTSSNSTAPSQIVVTTAPPPPDDVVLEPFKIPKFGGNLYEWPAWWDCFQYAVHNTNKAKPYKLLKLREALFGTAESAIGKCPSDAGGYDEAIKILQSEFGNETAIKENLYFKLQNIRPANGKREDLRRFVDEVDQLCASLERLGESVDTLQFATLLQDRLPDNIKRTIVREKRNLPVGQSWNTTRLRRSLKEIVNCEEEVNRSMYREKSPAYRNGHSSHTYDRRENRNEPGPTVSFLSTNFSQKPKETSAIKPYKNNVESCTKTRNCKKCGDEKHHEIICNKFENAHVTNTSKNANKTSESPELTVLKCTPILINSLETSRQSVSALAVLDDGSNESYISTNKAAEAGLKKGTPIQIRVGTFGNSELKQIKGNRTEMVWNTRSGPQKFPIIIVDYVAQTVPHILTPSQNPTEVPKMISQFHYKLSQPDILIGNDNYYKLKPITLMQLSNGYTLVDSEIGLMIGGKNIGIREETPEQHALELFYSSIKFNGKRYEVGLPWIGYPPPLPTNFALALGRLRSNLSKLKKQPEILKKYAENIQEQISLGILELAPPSSEGHPVHYLPHQAVVRADKGDRIRVVYDASSKVKGSNSLNDCLHSGPSMINDLGGVLIRSRISEIIITCDVEKAFNQVELIPRDRDVTRIFPFLLDGTLEVHLKNNPSNLSDEISLNKYVDNILLLSEDINEGQRKCTEAKELFRQAGMNLREFVSNSQETVSHLAEKDRLAELLGLYLVLGWLNSNTKQEIFVENRLKFIREIPNLNIRYVNTHENPSDLATRGCTAAELEANMMWHHGPWWLGNQDFWDKWQKDYLTSLRERAQKLNKGSKVAREPRIGEVVLIIEPDLPRGYWRLAVIQGLNRGEDGISRSATVRLASGKSLNRSTIMLIPLERICPLETSDEEKSVEPRLPENSPKNLQRENSVSPTHNMTLRPRKRVRYRDLDENLYDYE